MIHYTLGRPRRRRINGSFLRSQSKCAPPSTRYCQRCVSAVHECGNSSLDSPIVLRMADTPDEKLPTPGRHVNSSPVMYDASSETRKDTSLATSSGCPLCPSAHWNWRAEVQIATYCRLSSRTHRVLPCTLWLPGSRRVVFIDVIDYSDPSECIIETGSAYARSAVSIAPGAYAFTVIPYLP